MYPVLKIMHMLNFLDTFSMGITTFNVVIRFQGWRRRIHVRVVRQLRKECMLDKRNAYKVQKVFLYNSRWQWDVKNVNRYSIKEETKRIHLEVKNVARKVGMNIKFYTRRFIHLVSCLSTDNDTCYNNVESWFL